MKEAGLPNITGTLGSPVTGYGGVSGAFYITQSRGIDGVYSWSNSSNNRPTAMDASRSSAIYGKSNTVQPQSYTVVYIMRVR